MPEPLHVVLIVPGAGPPRGAVEAGMQRGREELEVGEPVEGGRRYDAELAVRRREDGTVRYSGPFVFGTGVEPFLYLSYRQRGAALWTRRSKVLLPTRLDAATRTLTARVTDVGGSRARIEEPGWEQSHGG